MSISSPSVPDLLRLCIVRGLNGPWKELLAALGDLVESAFRAVAPAHQVQLLDDFRDWLPGWLVEGQRLESAYAWLEERIREGDCSTGNEQERALRNYLQQTCRSGVGDFFRERSGRSVATRSQRALSSDAAETLVARPDRVSTEDQDRLSQVRQCLAELPPALRVPFRLRHYVSLGPLPREDLRWIAENCGQSVENVEQAIQGEAQDHQGAEFPLSAEFIGQLLQIPPAADGRFTTVDQRVCRARQRLRAQLASEEESR
jgi:DNA-directed RNA polymerase specialized sigma24 family protein